MLASNNDFSSVMPLLRKMRDFILVRKYTIFFIFLCIVGIFRIISTYVVFTQTADEPLHVARGMEWLERGTYSHLHHPPLGPIFVALGPFLDGVRINWTGDKHQDGNQILYYDDAYFRNLSLARLGTLVFFLIASYVVWIWTRELFGQFSAALAVLLFTTLPVILAHSGLATTDMAVTATLTLSLFCFCRWAEERSIQWTIAFGIASGLAVLSKFSALLFLPTCILVLLLLRRMTGQEDLNKGFFVRRSTIISLGISTFVAMFVIWAGYRFSLGTLIEDWHFLYVRLEKLVPDIPFLRESLQKIGHLRIIPAHELGSGVSLILKENAKGHASYFLGKSRWSEGGSLLFFPVVLAIKSPIPFLILTAGGLVLVARKFTKDWKILSPAVAAITVFVCVLPSDINAGIRHILPVFPLLSIVAGFALSRLFRSPRPRRLSMVALLGLLVWHISSGALCHPDYLAFFNGLAGKNPESIVVDSDLDWGQDLGRLVTALKEREIEEFSLAYFGSADVYRHGLPKIHELEKGQPATGWVAISLFKLKINATRHYRWLSAYEPVETVGKSIRLYYIPPNEKNTPSVSCNRQ